MIINCTGHHDSQLEGIARAFRSKLCGIIENDINNLGKCLITLKPSDWGGSEMAYEIFHDGKIVQNADMSGAFGLEGFIKLIMSYYAEVKEEVAMSLDETCEIDVNDLYNQELIFRIVRD